MSRKDYIKIARSIYHGGLNHGSRIIVAMDLIKVFEADNPRFNATRFLEAAIHGKGIK